MTTIDLPPASSTATEPERGPGSPTVTSMRSQVSVITQRELMARLRDRTFIVMTVFLLIVIVAAIAIPVLMNRGDPHLRVGTVGAAAGTIAADAAQLGHLAGADATDGADGTPAARAAGLDPARIDVRTFPDTVSAEAALRAGTVDAALVPMSGPAGSGRLELVAENEVPKELTPLVAAAARQRAMSAVLQSAGLDAAGADRALASASAPGNRLLQAPETDRALAFGLGASFAMVFFLASMIFGQSIAQSVVEEKESRVVEILVAAVPVRSLLVAKVTANTVLALGQTLLLAAVGLAGAGIAGQSTLVRMILTSGGWFLVFFMLGFTMLATLWAASGSVASRVQDLQATTVPLQFLLFAPFFGAMSVHSPGMTMRILSYVPFTSPTFMPQRLMLGDAAWWEALISAGIVVVTAWGVVFVASRLYERNVLRMSGRVPWREAWNG